MLPRGQHSTDRMRPDQRGRDRKMNKKNALPEKRQRVLILPDDEPGWKAYCLTSVSLRLLEMSVRVLLA